MTPSPTRCAWSTEYGDGFFRVSADLVGDFSIMCRFGGGHALTRDKTTLIFKYQNSTGKGEGGKKAKRCCAVLCNGCDVPYTLLC